jgi:GT2 family glycosyltransferase
MPAPASPQLSVSLVTYHSDLPLLQRTLDSLVVATAGLRVELVVVDNSVDSAYGDMLRSLLQRYAAESIAPRLELACRNAGYGAAHNRAVALCSAPAHLVLNPDVELSPDSLREGLALLAQDAAVALVAPHVVDGGGETQYLCKRYPSVRVFCLRAFAPRWLRDRHAERLEHYEMHDVCNGRDSAQIPLASGCFMLLRRAAFDAVGGFDEAFFLYFEDYDLSLRLAREGRLQYEPGVRIVHHGGFAARKGWRHLRLFGASAARFFARHGWRW